MATIGPHAALLGEVHRGRERRVRGAAVLDDRLHGQEELRRVELGDRSPQLRGYGVRRGRGQRARGGVLLLLPGEQERLHGGFGREFRAESGGQADDQDADGHDRDRRDARALSPPDRGRGLAAGPAPSSAPRGGPAGSRPGPGGAACGGDHSGRTGPPGRPGWRRRLAADGRPGWLWAREDRRCPARVRRRQARARRGRARRGRWRRARGAAEGLAHHGVRDRRRLLGRAPLAAAASCRFGSVVGRGLGAKRPRGLAWPPRSFAGGDTILLPVTFAVSRPGLFPWPRHAWPGPGACRRSACHGRAPVPP